MHDLYIEQLRALYDAEEQLRKGFPAAVSAAGAQELKDALEEQVDQSEDHASRLKELLKSARASVKPKKCAGMAGLAAELQELIESDIEAAALDAGIIACAQRIKHYEIAAYGCLCAYARLMGRDDDADILQESLDEEKEADEVFTDIADTAVNHHAHTGEAPDEEDETDEVEDKEPSERGREGEEEE